ncbi:kinase-like domain-containing protein [Lophiotrema nucula]|uniref:Kinase-like domain-containing protein n=1 Tax=Lophiotrema nucula TaxID=690887 RepID=A0A6A5Z0E4_9PLEO|nr:kinase-like domain-containing protein [Lophiotrema nucula]
MGRYDLCNRSCGCQNKQQRTAAAPRKIYRWVKIDDMPITTEIELHQFLSSKDIPHYGTEVAAGGSANFCWRIKTPLGKRSIVKHAEPFVRIMPEIPLPIERMDYEHLALTTIPNIVSTNEHVLLPQIYNYFPEEHVICMSDGGSQNLKESYKSDVGIDIPILGQRIGFWLARLHKETSQPETLEFVKRTFDSEVAKSVFRYTYNGLTSVLKQHGHDPALGERINARFGTEDASDRVCLCHGDFWLPNIQIENQDPAIEVEEEEERKLRAPVLTVIDWENVRVGNGATDVGRFAADSWLVDRFHGDKGMFEAFLKAYLTEHPLKQRDKIRLVVHFAVHIIFYSRMRWTDEEGTTKLVRLGKAMLEAVDTEDLTILARGPLAQLFSESE